MRCAEVYKRWWETGAFRVPNGIAPSLALAASIAAGIASTGILRASSTNTIHSIEEGFTQY